ncbi:MAG: hypothetical protein LBD70_01015 [Bifidobacteriaceae bacterium]|jgi:hypothetical protein|nr:hypothetical protein [Bifidobacteriaceae bacterium]
MRIDEFRELLRHYDADRLREIAAELYKALPKDKKTPELDKTLRAFTKGSKLVAPRAAVVDFDELAAQVEEFLENANEGLYFQPNRVIPKARRTKWRFEARRLIKGLIAARGEDSEAAAQLLLQVYNMLSHACAVYIFPTDSPFSAVGYRQSELLGLALEKLLSLGVTPESAELAVCTTLASYEDRETWHLSLLDSLVGALKTNPAKEAAREVAKGFPQAYERYRQSRRLFRLANDGWTLKGNRDRAVELYLMLSLALSEPDQGIAYYRRHYKGPHAEGKLYILLSHFLNDPDLSDYWIREYESAVAAGTKPRDSIRQEYAARLSARPNPA